MVANEWELKTNVGRKFSPHLKFPLNFSQNSGLLHRLQMEDEDKLLYGEEGGGEEEEDSQDVEATREDGVEEAPVTEEKEVRQKLFF